MWPGKKKEEEEGKKKVVVYRRENTLDERITLKSERSIGSSRHGSVIINPTSILEDTDLIPGLAQWVKDPVLP